MYKCTLNSTRITYILVSIFNIFLRNYYYPRRWSKIIETTLEKGKGPILGKLRNITLIEADLQIGMRISLNSEKEELIENDERFSKVNYRSRKNYSITSAIF